MSLVVSLASILLWACCRALTTRTWTTDHSSPRSGLLFQNSTRNCKQDGDIFVPVHDDDDDDDDCDENTNNYTDDHVEPSVLVILAVAVIMLASFLALRVGSGSRLSGSCRRFSGGIEA